MEKPSIDLGILQVNGADKIEPKNPPDFELEGISQERFDLSGGHTTEFTIGPAHPGHPDYHILYDEKGNPRCDQDGNPLYLSYQPKKE